MNETIRQEIEAMIHQDEGGWVLTENAHDPGGLTYGGMIYRTYNEIAQELGFEVLSPKAFRELASQGSELLKSYIINCYEKRFLTDSNIGRITNVHLRAITLSAAVNRGVTNGVIALQTGVNNSNLFKTNLKVDGQLGPKTLSRVNELDDWPDEEIEVVYKKVCQAWAKQYIDLVQDNSKAWYDYANGKGPKPTTFRAWNLEGWLNRVERYR